MISISVLFAVATPFVAVLSTSVVAQRYSRERTLAEQAATAQIESARSLAYDDVGVAGGNPSGKVTASIPLTLKGIQATLTTQVTYVNDPTPTGYVTKADYKKVVVTVLRNKDAKQLAKDTTFIAPQGDGTYDPEGRAIITVQVVDLQLNAAIPGATVSLATGPSAPRTDVTDAGGNAVFPDLTINPTTGSQKYYDLTTTATGYQTDPDDVSPNGKAHVSLVAGQTFPTVLRVFKPSTIYVTLNTSSGAAYTGAATVTVSSSRQTQSFAYPGATMAVTSLNGESILPNLTYTVTAQQTASNLFAPASAKVVPSNYPAGILTQNYTLQFVPDYTLTVTVKKASGGALVSGATVNVTGGSPYAVVNSGITNASGIVTFSLPAGTGYVVKATSGSMSGTWTGTGSGTISANTSATISVS